MRYQVIGFATGLVHGDDDVEYGSPQLVVCGGGTWPYLEWLERFICEQNGIDYESFKHDN